MLFSGIVPWLDFRPLFRGEAMLLDSGVERRAPPMRAGALARTAAFVGHSLFPALALAGAFMLAWACRGETASDFRLLANLDPSLDPGEGNWLNWGVLLLPGVFFVLNLTSRRYGPSVALASVVAGWASIGGGIYWAVSEGVVGAPGEVVPMRIAAAFAGAMFLGQLVNICLFDWLRGIPWWQAPFVAALLGGLVFVGAFHAGTGGDWSAASWPRLGVLGSIQFIWALAQLAPTRLLRRAIRPASGYGGA